jgi:hypothetical protein
MDNNRQGTNAGEGMTEDTRQGDASRQLTEIPLRPTAPSPAASKNRRKVRGRTSGSTAGGPSGA